MHSYKLQNYISVWLRSQTNVEFSFREVASFLKDKEKERKRKTWFTKNITTYKSDSLISFSKTWISVKPKRENKTGAQVLSFKVFPISSSSLLVLSRSLRFISSSERLNPQEEIAFNNWNIGVNTRPSSSFVNPVAKINGLCCQQDCWFQSRPPVTVERHRHCGLTWRQIKGTHSYLYI